MHAESSWLILLSICKLFNQTLDEADHFLESSLIRSESHQKQQAVAGCYQVAEWGQIHDSPSSQRDSIIQRCYAQQALLSVLGNFTSCMIL